MAWNGNGRKNRKGMKERRLGINNNYYPHMLSCHISWPITFWAAVTNPRSSPGVQLSSFRVIIIIIIEPTIVLRSTSSLVGVWMLPSRRWCCLCRWQPLHRNEGWQRTSSRSSCPNCVDRLSLLGRRCCSSLPRVEYVWIMLGLFRNRRQRGEVQDGRDFRFPSHYICPGIDITSDAIILPSSYNWRQ